MANGIEQELLALRKQIDTSKASLQRAQGRLEAAKDSLKRNFKVDSLDKAEKLLAKTDADIEKATDELEKGVAAIKEKYGDG